MSGSGCKKLVFMCLRRVLFSERGSFRETGYSEFSVGVAQLYNQAARRAVSHTKVATN